jgi:hypothetical protein
MGLMGLYGWGIRDRSDRLKGLFFYGLYLYGFNAIMVGGYKGLWEMGYIGTS